MMLQGAAGSPIGQSVQYCTAPDEGNMHMPNVITTDALQAAYLAPLASGQLRS